MFRSPQDAARVIPGLSMGSAASARHAARLMRDGIDCVVDLREEGSGVFRWPPEVLVRRVPLVDHGTPSADELRAAAATVSSLVGQGHEVLVHCHAGIERTPMVVCAALVMMGWSLTDAYQRVLEVRPEAAPTDGQLGVLRVFAAELAMLEGSEGDEVSGHCCSV
jgi:Dual specificity phosphatase, catalytic domain